MLFRSLLLTNRYTAQRQPRTTNKSSQLVGGLLHPSTIEAGPNNPQRVVVTRWGLSPTCDAASNHQRVVMTRWCFPLSMPAQRVTTTRWGLPPTRDAGSNHQQVITTRWWVPFILAN